MQLWSHWHDGLLRPRGERPGSPRDRSEKTGTDTWCVEKEGRRPVIKTNNQQPHSRFKGQADLLGWDDQGCSAEGAQSLHPWVSGQVRQV